MGFNRLRDVLLKGWRRYIVDECPDARIERIRRERINRIKQDLDLMDSMLRWEDWNQRRWGRS